MQTDGLADIEKLIDEYLQMFVVNVPTALTYIHTRFIRKLISILPYDAGA
jgi:hypothetical protein